MKRSLIAFSLLAVTLFGTSFTAVAQSPAGQPHLLYLPDNDLVNVDHAAIMRAFESEGFVVENYAYTNIDRLTYARDISNRIQDLMSQGIDPADISVMGAGLGSDIALLTSAVTGNRHVNYVVLGGCNRDLKDHMRLSGNVMALRDVADASSQSCRPFFTGSPRLNARKDLKLVTSYGRALFNTAHAEWTKPASEWMRQGKVNVGEINVAVGEP